MYRHPCVVLLLFKFSLALLSNLNSWIYIEKWRDRKLKQQQNSTRVTVDSDIMICCKNAVEKNCSYQQDFSEIAIRGSRHQKNIKNANGLS